MQIGIRLDKREIRPGDLVFFTGRNARSKKVGHVGIVVDSGKNGNFIFIHASTSKGVTVTSSTEDYYRERYLSARRVVK
jgi:cell wall-associated NlpC family hydrolase